MRDVKDIEDNMKKFKLLKCLGNGSYGTVFQAEDIQQNNPPYAVKIIIQEEPQDSEELRLLDKTRREYAVTIGLHHPNLIKISEFFEQKLTESDFDVFDNVSNIPEIMLDALAIYKSKAARKRKPILGICIKMPLCGETLFNWLDICDDKNKDTQIMIVTGLFEGLKFLHDNKVIHRDLHPGNIMFDKSGYKLPIKIGDFGLCRLLHSDASKSGSSMTGNVGHEMYRAPEIAASKYGKEVDIFSLGLVIWEVLELLPNIGKAAKFAKLVYDQDHSVICIDNNKVKECIVHMTKKNVVDRVKSLNDIDMRMFP